MSELLLRVAGEKHDNARILALASSLKPAELAELLDELRCVGSAPGRHGQEHELSICRLLLSLESTREDAIVICIHHLHDQRIRDRAGMSCLPELRAAIVQRASCDRELTAATVSFLQRVCEAVVGFLSDESLACKSPAQLGGHIQALELLPATLECAGSALLLRGSTDVLPLMDQMSEVRTATVQRVLEADWPTRLLLPLFSALSEVDLSPAERHAMYFKVEGGLKQETGSVGGRAGTAGISRADLESDIVGLIQVALEAAGRYKDGRAMGLVRRLLRLSPASLLSDVLCVVHMALQNGTIELGLLVAAIERAASGSEATAFDCGNERVGETADHGKGWRGDVRHAKMPVEANSAQVGGEPSELQPASSQTDRLCATDITLLLSAAQNALLRDAIMDNVTHTLLRHASSSFVYASADSSSSGLEARRVEATQRLVSEVVVCAHSMWLSSLLLDLAECLLETEGREGCAGRKIGQALLENLFRSQPHARGEVLSRLFTSLAQHVGWPLRLTAILSSLRCILRNHLLSIRPYEQQISQGFSLLWLLPLREAKQAMAAVIPACIHLQTLRDRMLLTLRKELYCGQTARVRLAVFGQCQMLAEALLPLESEQVEALTALKPLLASTSPSLSIRAEIYAGLHRVLTRLRVVVAGDSKGAAREVLHSESARLLHELVLVRYVRLLHCPRAAVTAQSKQSIAHVKIIRCFETLSFEGQRIVRLRESLPPLLACLRALLGKGGSDISQHPFALSSKASARSLGPQALLEALSVQLSDAEQVADMLAGTQDSAQASVGSMIPPQPAERQALVVGMYQLLMDECAAHVSNATESSHPASSTPLPVWAIPPHLRAPLGRGKEPVDDRGGGGDGGCGRVCDSRGADCGDNRANETVGTCGDKTGDGCPCADVPAVGRALQCWRCVSCFFCALHMHACWQVQWSQGV